MDIENSKIEFAVRLSEFAEDIGDYITEDGEWTIKGFIDSFRNIYTVSTDTKVVSKIIELHLFPHLLAFAGINGYRLELATYQNWYPDLTFVNKNNEGIKFAVDLKTTYKNEDRPGFCNGFTLGSHGEYFTNREGSKNIQYPYGQYAGHFCLGIIYARNTLPEIGELNIFSLDELERIPSVINDFTFFAVEKWKIASDKSGSGNTANIGSIKCIADILAGNGVFSRAGEEIFDDYWTNYGKIQIEKGGKRKTITSLREYLDYRGLPETLLNPAPTKSRRNGDE